MDRENYDDYDEVVTIDELSKKVDQELNSMSVEERHQRLVQCDPTYLQYTLSLASNIIKSNPEAKFLINEYTYKFEVL